MAYKLPYEIPDPVPREDVIIDMQKFEAFYKGRLLSKKRRFEYACRECGKTSISSRAHQIKRKFPWKCESCARFEEWSGLSKNERSERLSEVHRKARTKQGRKRASRIMKEKWKDENSWWRTEFVSPMKNPKTCKKVSKTIKRKLIEDDGFRNELLSRAKNNSYGTLIECSQPDGTLVTLRSTFEQRVSIVLSDMGYDWKYEPKTFYLDKLDKTYTPDFYIPSLDLWIEVKGFWHGDSRDKWVEFSRERKSVVLFKDDIEDLENGGSLEDKVD